jgi:hypothetical protein
MAFDRVTALHVGLNSERFAGLLLYRLNTVLHPVAVTVNCLLGCVLSGYTEPMPALIARGRAAIAGLPGTPTPLRSEYISVVDAYFEAVEAEIGEAD